MAPPLLLVPSTFLTFMGLSSFYSVNPCFATALLSMNIPVAPLSKSAFTVTPSWVSSFSTLIFNHTSLSILKVHLTSLCLPPSFAVPSRTPACAPLYCAFPLLECATSTFFLFWYPHHFYLSEITSCPLFFSTWHPFCPHLSHSTYDTITSFIYHPSSNRYALSGTPSPQYSCTFHHRMCAGLLFYSFCCAFCGMATYTASSAIRNFFSFFQREHSLHLCPFSLHLKHSTSTASCFLIILSFTSHCITLLVNTSNLFWGAVPLFFSSFLFLQFQTRYLNPLQFQHSHSFFPFNFALNKTRACFCLSKLLINKLYCYKDMVLHLCKGMEVMLIFANYHYICWGARSSPS